MSEPSTSSERRTLLGEAIHEEEIKRSRFIARATSVSSSEQALEFVASVGEPKATHNCWAFRIGEIYRSSDDGEPSGTAGRPILGAIDRSGLDQVVVVVTRYFGGIKLGAGGLARAYGGSAASCLQGGSTTVLRTFVHATVKVSYEQIARAQQLVRRSGAERLGERYVEEGLILELEVDSTTVSELSRELKDQCRGQASLRLNGIPGVPGEAS